MPRTSAEADTRPAAASRPEAGTAPSEQAARAAEHLEQALREGRIDLPVLPSVCLQVLEMTRDEDADAASMSKVLHGDPALAGHVLRVANSPQFAGRCQVSNLQQAISRVGLALIAEIALNVSLKGTLFDADRRPELVRSMWRHATTTAFASKGIARHMRRNAENVYLAGLLHDVGRAVVLGEVQQYEDASGLALADREVLPLLEQHRIRAGLALAESWSLPQVVVQVIEAQRVPGDDEDAAPGSGPGVTDVSIVTLASRFAGYGLADLWPVSEPEIRRLPLLDVLALYPEDLDRMFEAVPTWVEAAHELST